MNLKISYKYQMHDHKTSLLVYYFVIALIIAAVSIMFAVALSHADGFDGSVEGGILSGSSTATIIFLGIVGICAFKEPFGMMIQNGMSRRSILTGRIFTVLTVAAIAAVADLAVVGIISAIVKLSGVNLTVISTFETVYGSAASAMGFVQTWATSLLMDFLTYVFIMTAGYMVGAGFSRMNKAARIAVGISVPVFFTTILPIVDMKFFKGAITTSITNAIDFSLGLTAQEPFRAFISIPIAAAAVFVATWFIVRRAPLKG